jgi:hypothetical protein
VLVDLLRAHPKLNAGRLVTDLDRPTTCKIRVMSGAHQMVRIDAEAKADITAEVEATIASAIKDSGDRHGRDRVRAAPVSPSPPTCLFRQHSPRWDWLIEARRGRQTEQIELPNLSVIDCMTLALVSHEHSPRFWSRASLVRPKPGYSMTRTGLAGSRRATHIAPTMPQTQHADRVRSAPANIPRDRTSTPGAQADTL